MSVMTLREVCEELSVSRRTIQGYEKMGLLQPSGRNERGWLLYDGACREKIRLIMFYQEIGLQRKEIRYIQTAAPEERKDMLLRQRERIQRDMKEKEDLIKVINELIGKEE